MNSETDIALIKKDIKYLKDGIDEIKESIKCQSNDFVKDI